MKAPSSQLIVALLLIGLFGFAYYNNPQDEMMKGALIAAFAAAYSYWLGSSNGSKDSGDALRRIAEQPSVIRPIDPPPLDDGRDEPR